MTIKPVRREKCQTLTHVLAAVSQRLTDGMTETEVEQALRDSYSEVLGAEWTDSVHQKFKELLSQLLFANSFIENPNPPVRRIVRTEVRDGDQWTFYEDGSFCACSV